MELVLLTCLYHAEGACIKNLAPRSLEAWPALLLLSVSFLEVGRSYFGFGR